MNWVTEMINWAKSLVIKDKSTFNIQKWIESENKINEHSKFINDKTVFFLLLTAIDSFSLLDDRDFSISHKKDFTKIQVLLKSDPIVLELFCYTYCYVLQWCEIHIKPEHLEKFKARILSRALVMFYAAFPKEDEKLIRFRIYGIIESYQSAFLYDQQNIYDYLAASLCHQLKEVAGIECFDNLDDISLSISIWEIGTLSLIVERSITKFFEQIDGVKS